MKAKALCFAILMLISCAHVCAQDKSPIAKGSLIIGGSFSFYNTKNTDYDASSTYISIRPSLLYFFFSSCAIGANLEIANASYGNSDSHMFAIGPKIVYFFNTKMDNMYPYLGASFELSSESSYTGTALHISTGLATFLVSHVSLDGEIFFKLEHLDPDYEYSSSHTYRTFGVQFGLSAFIY